MKKSKKLTGILLVFTALIFAASFFSWGSSKESYGEKRTEPTGAAERSESPETPTMEFSDESHVHSWTAIRETVHHDAFVDDVWVLDKEAWTEPLEAARRHCACRCGFDGSYETVSEHIQTYRDAWAANKTLETEAEMQKHFLDTSNKEDWIIHEAEGHWEKQTIREAYDSLETVGYQCSECGAVQ